MMYVTVNTTYDSWTYNCCVQVADAVGAAVGQISGEHQEMIPVSSKLTVSTDQLIEQCIAKAKDKAIANGANPHSLTIIEKYIDPGTRVYTKVVGYPKEDLEEEITDMQTSSVKDDFKLILKHEIKTEDNPSWPFENKEVAKLDKQFGLPEPIISMC